MRKIETLNISLNGLRSNKLRTGLTMLGIIFGVAAVIAMMSIGEGARQETLQQIELMGTNNIIVKKVVTSGQSSNTKASFSPGLTLQDANSIKDLNPLVKNITPQREVLMQISYKSTIEQLNIIGTTPDYPETFNTKLFDGSFFKSFHLDDYSNVCVIGPGIKEKFFKFEDPIKKNIKIGNLWFTIIGLTTSKNVSSSGADGLGLRNFNDDIYIPITTMMYKLVKVEVDQQQLTRRRGMIVIAGQEDNTAKVVDRNSVDQLTINVKNSDYLKEAAYLTEKILNRRHFGVKDYSIILPEQLLEQKQKTQRIFNIVMGAIAGISLLVGGIGIMNIMLANILERTREIGVRRAVGATKTDVLQQFIFEAIIISIIGGLIGVVLGFILTSAISTYAEWNTIISASSVFLAFIVSVTTGLIFGIYPAKKAAEKSPIESLRYE